MALLSTYNSTNRVIDAGLSVVYSRRKIYGSWSYTQLSVTTTITEAWEYIRRATKTYKYVGMTYEAAKACQAAMVAIYTRSTKTSEFQTSGAAIGTFVAENAGSVPMADVVVQLDEGEAYSCVISVREEDARISISSNESFDSLFSAEQSRSYDGETEVPEE